MSGVQQTSLQAYEKVRRKSEPSQMYRVLCYLRDLDKYGTDATNKEIEHFLGLQINVVTARVNKLRQMGLVEFSRERRCTWTREMVMAWRVKTT